MKLIGKLIIQGQIETLTGLHIGGSKTSMDIGEVDLNVIKTPNGVPFIPGSSLKGKMRAMLAKLEGSLEVREDSRYIKEIFGSAADQDKDIVTRLIVRDAPLDTAAFAKTFKGADMDFDYSSIKFENRIDRRNGTARDPRQLERVPAGAKFGFEMVYDLYDDGESAVPGDSVKRLTRHLLGLYRAMQLLQDDYLGGQGSRGYGKIRFNQTNVLYKKIQEDGAYTLEAPTSDLEDFQRKLEQLPAEALPFVTA